MSRIVDDPSLADLLNLVKKEIFLTMNCHAIAVIQEFDATTQRVKATIAYKKVFIGKDDQGRVTEIKKDYPILLDCPVIIMGGGGAFLSMPISPGDECMILFNDRDIDNWLHSGQVMEPATARLHSFSDGVALIGLRSAGNAIASYDGTRARLQNGSTYVGVGATKVKIDNGTTTLNTLLASLIDAIKAITTTNAVVGAPCTISAASQTQLTTIKTQIAGLLE